ncbi:sulfatase [Opitutaceae bacterium EW11]|nr:sulfatase [Opitutaceae bacterium EW11]
MIRASHLLALALAFGGSALSSAAEASHASIPIKRPNIVFIFSDDHAWQAVSAYGDGRKLIETPNIDRLGREGVRFDRCLVPNPLCGPSRATMLTGLYNHVNGFVNNSNKVFDNKLTTFPRLLHDAGYQTAVVGKWHLESDPTGFDHWQILPGQGDYYNAPMIRNGEKIIEPGYVTDVITDRSIEWLENRDKSKPFLLMTHHKAPHRSWMPALRHLNADGDRRYEEPTTLFDNYAGRGAAEKGQDMMIANTLNDVDLKFAPPARLTDEQRREWDAYYGPRNEAFRAANLQGRDLVRWKYQRYMHDYLACIRAVDESVGRLLDYLDREGLAENTIVVYSSDQGFFLGEHGWFDKRWIFEESSRTPLLVRWPAVAKPGGVVRDIVSNVDFAETFLDAAGLAVPPEMQGRSFVPLLRGERPADWRTAFYFQYFEYPAFHRVRPHYGVVTDRYKLVHFPVPPDASGEEYWELFDLNLDPHEMTSVFGEERYAETQKELMASLSRLRRELKVPEQIPDDWFGIKTQYPAHLQMVKPGTAPATDAPPRHP